MLWLNFRRGKSFLKENEYKENQEEQIVQDDYCREGNCVCVCVLVLVSWEVGRVMRRDIYI